MHTVEVKTIMADYLTDVQPLLTHEQIGISTDPAVNGGHQIRSWVQTCNASHEDCMKRRKATPKAKRFSPTRLLDISGPPQSPIRVVETSKTPIRSPYCSLSHRWGETKFVQLHIENRKRFMEEGVEWHLLPQNFQEAIQIARTLEVYYIWIDSLCIIQDSDEDWKHEAGRMHSVYRNSYCNIAIADSKEDRKGAFRTRKPKDVAPVRFQAKNEAPFFGKKNWVIVPENLWDRELLQADLYARGWVFQERMLSPRILHFTRKQVFWDCPSLSACETLPAGLPQPMDNAAGPDRHWRGRLQEPEDNPEPMAGANDQSMDAFWKTAVQKYTSCNLTYGKDKLIAMWGIAKLMRDITNVEYGKGLFEENLEDQLAWRVEETRLTERPNESTKEKVARNIPSWSWASMDGRIVVPDRLSDQPHFKVTDHEGRALTFDLVGVKRSFRAAPARAGDNAPPAPTRGTSDSVLELQRREKNNIWDNTDLRNEKQFHRSISPEKIDRSLEPSFHSDSIRIHGHVGHGQIHSTEDGWRLELKGVPKELIEAFPDLMPSSTEATDTFFMVLAAKQVLKPSLFVLERLQAPTRRVSALADIKEDDSNSDDFYYAGHGILLRLVDKNRGNHRFRRSGAFRFQGATKPWYERMQRTVDHNVLPEDVYDEKRGRKIWLE